MTTTKGPLPVNITLDRVAQVWAGKPVHVRVIDDGSLPLHVMSRTVLLHFHCAMSSAPQVKVTPSQFNLIPGQGLTTTVIAPSTKGDYGVLFAATTGHGSVHLAAAVGSQLLAGKAKTACPASG